MSSFYTQSIPPMVQWLTNAQLILSKAESWAKAKGLSDADVLKLSLTADMKDLAFQVFTFTRFANEIAEKVTGKAPVALKASDSSVADLRERIQTVQAHLKSLPTSDASKADDSSVVDLGFGKFQFTTTTFVHNFGLPNFYFHYTTFYDILRKEGLEIGKGDFLQGIFVPAA